jgi:DNA ligase-1
MKYEELVKFYETVSETTKRLEKIDILSKFLGSLSLSDKDVMYLLLGSIYPEYSEKKIGISNQLVIKSISKATGIEVKKVIHEWKAIGDLGKVAEKFTLHKKQSILGSRYLTTEKVLENLRKLPELGGKGTINKKLRLIIGLLNSSSPVEALYLVRTLIGDLRIGIKESTVRDAIALAFFDGRKDVSEKVQGAIDKSNDLAFIFEIARKRDLDEFKKVGFLVGKPIKAMLAQKVSTIKEGFKIVGSPCAVEYKYDGFRVLIHKKDSDVKLFTRRLENVTKQFPEVVDHVLKYVKGDSFVLDAEVVGYDKRTEEYTSFQAISQRIRRKYHIEKLQKELPVELNVFDILFYNGRSLLEEVFLKRSKLLRKVVKNHRFKIVVSEQVISGDEKKVQEFYDKALAMNQEGIMMRSLNAIYKPGKRVGQMLKLKPEERDLDLVITGAEYGSGRRRGWMSSFILACRGKKGEFLNVGKVGTGIKEKLGKEISFEGLTKILKPLVIKEKGKSVKVKPKIVVSVTYQEIQKSPNYSSGWALRFPRFTALRSDKPLSEINSLEDVEKNFKLQKKV